MYTHFIMKTLIQNKNKTITICTQINYRHIRANNFNKIGIDVK